MAANCYAFILDKDSNTIVFMLFYEATGSIHSVFLQNLKQLNIQDRGV